MSATVHAPRIQEKVRTKIFLSLVVLLLAFSYAQFIANHTLGLPIQDAFYGSDANRIYDNLRDAGSSYHRIDIHPWFGWVALIYQYVQEKLDLEQVEMLKLFSSFSGALHLFLFQIVAGQLGFRAMSALSLTALYASTGAFMFWVAIPETHMIGAMSLLVCVLLLQLRNTAAYKSWPSEKSLLLEGLIVAVSLSMVVSNIMLWFLSQLDAEKFKAGRFGFLLKAEWGKLSRNFLIILTGVGLSYLGYIVSYVLLGKPNSFGHLFAAGEELQFLSWGDSAGIFNSLTSLGLIAPSLEGAGPGLLLLSFICLVVVGANVRRANQGALYLCLYPFFGTVFHLVYDRPEAFLFSPNYAWATVLSIGFVVRAKLGRCSIYAILVSACILGWYNYEELQTSYAYLSKNGMIYMKY